MYPTSLGLIAIFLMLQTNAWSQLGHETWDQLLRQHVSSIGKVDYVAIKGKKAALGKYLSTLSTTPPATSWSKKETMAYWINLYNAYTVKLIVDNYPLGSIRELENGKVWDKKWIPVGGKTYSLNQIEHDILRPKYKDARIHFTVNCAAKSCPPLLNAAYTAEKLESQLESQTKKFINNSQYNSLEPGKVAISRIFDWYKEDFGNVVEYLDRYAELDIEENAIVSYKSYNWDLNGK